MENEVAVVESPVAVAVSPEATVAVEARAKSPSPVEFAAAWNSSNTRAEVLTALAAAGTPMTYSAMVARAKSYKDKGITLKDVTPGKRGRKTNVAEINEAIAQQAAAAAVSE